MFIERLDWLVIALSHFVLLSAGGALQSYLAFHDLRRSLRMLLLFLIAGGVFFLLGLIDQGESTRYVISPVYLVCFTVGVMLFSWSHRKHIVLRLNAPAVLLYLFLFWFITLQQLSANGLTPFESMLISITGVVTLLTLLLSLIPRVPRRDTIEIVLYLWVVVFIAIQSSILFYQSYQYLFSDVNLTVWSIHTFDMFFAGAFLFYTVTLVLSILLVFPIFGEKGESFKQEQARASNHMQKINDYFHDGVFTRTTCFFFLLFIAGVVVLKNVLYVPDGALLYIVLMSTELFLYRK